MLRTRIAGAAGALALLAAPAVAVAHGDGHHHKGHHHAKKPHPRDVTGSASATVQSFANGELTLALPSGRTFTADVTRRTVILCRAAAPAAAAKAAHHGDGDATTTAPASTTTPPPTTVPGAGHGRCGADRLVAGAKVLAAKLSLQGDVVTWKKVIVVS